MTLKAMRELPEYEMARGSPDILGWAVHDSDNHLVGTVIDLVVETSNKQVRYVGVQLGSGKTVMLPLDSLELSEEDGVIQVSTCTRDEILALPGYTIPALKEELVARYDVLFKRKEPAGAAEVSPPDYQLGKVLVTRLRHVSSESHSHRAEHLPGDRFGVFAANMPWNIADIPMRVELIEKGMEAPFAEFKMGPNCKREVLWQSQQAALRSALEELFHPPITGR